MRLHSLLLVLSGLTVAAHAQTANPTPPAGDQRAPATPAAAVTGKQTPPAKPAEAATAAPVIAAPAAEVQPTSDSVDATAETTPAAVEAVVTPPVPVATKEDIERAQAAIVALNAEITARMQFVEKALLAQRDREMQLYQETNDIYRETNRTVTTLAVTCATIGFLALVASAIFLYRTATALSASTRRDLSALEGATTSLPSPSIASAHAQGIDRVQASGQRFQSRMSSLEDRLAELEHMTGREGAAHATPVSPHSTVSGESEAHASPAMEAIEPPPRRVIPRAAILVNKAQTQLSLGRCTEALATLDEASAIEPDNSDVHLTRGQALEKTGRMADALLAYEKSVGLDGSNTNALLLKAGLLNRQERFDEALVCYERALEVHRAMA